jgi:hypothetical protein
MSGHPVALAAALACLLAVAATPAGAAGVGLGDTEVTPTGVETGTTATLDLSVNATDVDASDGTTGANVTVSAPAALDLSGATVDARAATPNATGVGASVDAAANAVVVSWDDDGGVSGETVQVTATVSGVAVDRTGEYDLTATVDADGDGATDVRGVAGTVTAAATGSDRSVTAAGAVLYLGEEDVDLTGLDGVAPAGEPQRFHGVGGAAEGTVATADDAVAVDATRGAGFEPGTYSLEPGSDGTDLAVQRPNVTEIRLYPGETADGTEVAGSSIPATVETLTVDPRFDFGAAENATVVVETDAGLDVTDELTADPTVASSGETVRLDVADLPVGTYAVRVEGTDDLDHATETATIRIRTAARTVSVSRTRLVHGESTVATVSGAPGAVRYVRLSGDALADGESVTVPTAKAVVGATDGLVFVGADAAAEAVYAVVALDDEGFARVELDTERLAEGTHDVELAPNATADSEASVPLTVTDRTVSVATASDRLIVGETTTVSGTARGADDVKLYAHVGGEYAPLYADAEAADLAETRVAPDGSWSVDLDTRAVLAVPGAYRVAAVANPGDGALGSADRIDESTLRAFDDLATVTVETTDPSPSASVSRSRVATVAADEVRVDGRAPGPSERVRAYVVSPRGDVDPRDVAVAADDAFEFEYAAFDAPGRYRLLVVTAGRDGTFAFADGGDAAAVRRTLSGDETPEQAVATLRDAYGGAGVDDRVLALNVTATAPRVAVASVARRNDTLVVAGTSNREDGTVLPVDLRADGDVVAVGSATVNDSGRWRTTVDVATLDPGRYALRVETAGATDRRAVRLGDAATATPGPAATGDETPRTDGDALPTATPPATDEAAAVADGTPATTERATRTGARADGFGLPTALVATLAAFVLALGRRRP